MEPFFVVCVVSQEAFDPLMEFFPKCIIKTQGIDVDQEYFLSNCDSFLLEGTMYICWRKSCKLTQKWLEMEACGANGTCDRGQLTMHSAPVELLSWLSEI